MTLGNVTFQWGTADYPVRFEYDAYGKMEKMHTYRQVGADFSDPNLVAPVGDLTTWVYDPIHRAAAAETRCRQQRTRPTSTMPPGD